MTGFYMLETLGNTNDDKLAFVEDYVVGLEMDDWKTGFGHSTKKEWPADATMALRKGSGKKLSDLIGTVTNNLIVSKRLRSLIATHTDGIDVEYLPIRIHDHRKRLLSDEYVIVNPIGTVDCLDLKASDILWDEDDPKKALAVNKAVLSEKKVKRAPSLFRPKERPASYIISLAIARPIYDSGDYTNVFWKKLEIK
jgi:hypothetical protein